MTSTTPPTTNSHSSPPLKRWTLSSPFKGRNRKKYKALEEREGMEHQQQQQQHQQSKHKEKRQRPLQPLNDQTLNALSSFTEVHSPSSPSPSPSPSLEKARGDKEVSSLNSPLNSFTSSAPYNHYVQPPAANVRRKSLSFKKRRKMLMKQSLQNGGTTKQTLFTDEGHDDHAAPIASTLASTLASTSATNTSASTIARSTSDASQCHEKSNQTQFRESVRHTHIYIYIYIFI